MTISEAIKILETVCDNVNANRQIHSQIQEALTTIKNAVQQKGKK